ncbi:MAG: YciI family protein [Proteobacteria bacterium]|nr:YciI family protein [Pseudomonadota bacterium]
MRVMVIVKASPESEAGVMPSPEALAAMGRYNDDLIAAGVMLDGAGLRDSGKGARVRIQNGQATVTDGPFTETKELIAGYWIWQVASLDEAIEWARKAPSDGTEAFNLELRPFFEPEDFQGLATDEEIAKEQAWRDAQAAKAPTATA